MTFTRQVISLPAPELLHSSVNWQGETNMIGCFTEITMYDQNSVKGKSVISNYVETTVDIVNFQSLY